MATSTVYPLSVGGNGFRNAFSDIRIKEDCKDSFDCSSDVLGLTQIDKFHSSALYVVYWLFAIKNQDFVGAQVEILTTNLMLYINT
jgi:hypothetical protein